jgi:predicted CoA-binding protein
MEQDEAIRELLETCRVIAVVGLSADEDKPSNSVARYMKGKGYRIIPVNPGEEVILGEKSYKTLADIPEPVDVVDIFMRAERVLPFVEEAIKLKPKAIWLQLGIVNDEARAAVEKSGIMFVQDKCVKQEHGRLL